MSYDIPTGPDGRPLARIDENGDLTQLRGAFSFRPPKPAEPTEPAEVPTVQFPSGAEGHRLASAFGRAATKGRAPVPGLSERDYDRREQAARSSRQRKSNARRNKALRQRDTSLADLQAQIRVASGASGASEAMVANARRALEQKVEKIKAEIPGLSDEEAVEAIYAAAASL